MPIIQMEQVSYRYENASTDTLNNINLHIHSGEWVTIIGKNGSGKSTFGRLLNGLYIPTSGTVTIKGLNIASEANEQTIRQHVGVVFQNPDQQFVAPMVKDDLAFGLENRGFDRVEIEKRINKYAELIGITPFLHMDIHRLSGGQKQRVAIASMMVLEPSVLVFDEATSMLDPKSRLEVLQTMHMLYNRGTTIVSITHDMDEALLGNRIVLLDRGTIRADDAPIPFFHNETLLHELSFSSPFSITMQRCLEAEGIPFQKRCVTEEDIITELWTLFSKT